MTAGAHPWGVCICRTHLARPWNRPEHWTGQEVTYLVRFYGRSDDEVIARHLGRSVVGIRLKAKRLGIRKRDAADFTARALAEALGIPCSKTIAGWIAAGLLRARHGYTQGLRPVHLIAHRDAVAFLAAHPQLVDADRIPDWSPFASTVERWCSLPEVHRITGRSNLSAELRAGTIRGARRGPRWYVPAFEVTRIRCLAPEAIADSVFRRESVLERRRNRRKGVAA